VMIWIAYKPQVRTSATEQTEQAGAALAPSPSASPEALPSQAESPAAAEQPQPQPSVTQEPKDDGGGGDKGGGESKEPEKPKKPAVKPLVPAKNVMLRNTTTKMCAELPGREKGELNGRVQQSDCNEVGDNQIWDLEVKYPKGGPNGAPLFQIVNVKDRLCMDLAGYDAAPVTTDITEFTCDGTTVDNQLWWADKQESGDYWIRNFASNNKCLDVSGYSTGEAWEKLTLYHCSNSDDQEWKIIRLTKK
ncbi:RICIN domain-containing protein, partial [Streptomyces sp. NPDC096191]|uniref:RICIN domain-containing protein n=1 Tax=Streptomyces sp. NPDC096191 TaxID=3155426 RepID=UPI00331E21E7